LPPSSSCPHLLPSPLPPFLVQLLSRLEVFIRRKPLSALDRGLLCCFPLLPSPRSCLPCCCVLLLLKKLLPESPAAQEQMQDIHRSMLRGSKMGEERQQPAKRRQLLGSRWRKCECLTCGLHFPAPSLL
jgi:hypothetical protein